MENFDDKLCILNFEEEFIMKKIMVIMLCCCFFLSSFSFALSTKAFSIDLPDEFELKSESEYSTVYSNGKMEISYTFEKSGFGEFFMDVEEMKDDYSKSLLLAFMGFGTDAKVEKINGVNFLYDRYDSEYTSETSVNYLGTTANYLVSLSFSSENLDEDLVSQIMNTIKLKGMSGAVYEVFINGVYLLVIVAICGGIGFLKKKSKAKKEAKLNKESNDFVQDNNPIQNQEKTYYSNDPISQKKNDWNL